MEIVDELEGLPTDGRDRPREDAKIETRRGSLMATVEQQRASRSRSRTRRPARSSGSVHADHRRRAARDGRARPRRPAGLGGARLRRPRQDPPPRPEVGRPTTPSGSRRRSSRSPARPTRTRCSPRSPTPPTRSASGPSTRPTTWATRRSAPPTRSCSAASSSSRYRPVGLVGVIGPWNYPLTNSFGDCIPAMAAGNAVILKPAEVTPLTSLLLAEGMREVGLPEGVYQVAPGKRLGDRSGADRPRRHDHVHRLDRDRQEDHGPRGRAR